MQTIVFYSIISRKLSLWKVCEVGQNGQNETSTRNEGDSDEEDEEDEEEEEEDECVVKGKSTSLSQFYRLGGKVMGMIFKHSTEASPPEPREVEEEFWKLVIERDSHVVVHQVCY